MAAKRHPNKTLMNHVFFVHQMSGCLVCYYSTFKYVYTIFTLMSLSINDAQIFSAALKRARKKKHLTQAQCAELLDHSVSFQKDLERCRCSPSIENFYHICRTLAISADDCIRLLTLCDERSLSVLVATAAALAEGNPHAAPSVLEARQT